MSAVSKRAWWTVPGHFSTPMVLHVEPDLEESIFGHDDTHLRPIEVHSQTLIQLERWFTASGETRVTVVGPVRARQWLLDMFWCLRSKDSYRQAQGREMLRRVQNQPLTKDDLNTSVRTQPDTWDLSWATRMCRTTSLEILLTSLCQRLGLFGFRWSSLYPQ